MQFDHTVPEDEQFELIRTFSEMLWAPTKDGGKKRETGDKPSWKVDPDHVRGMFSHIGKWSSGETIDPDSGAHPLVHAAWRALAIAWQETNREFVPRWRDNEQYSEYEDFPPDSALD